MPIPLKHADFSEGSFTGVAKYLKRHWPDGEISLARARELLANCLGYDNVHEAEKSSKEVETRPSLAQGRLAAANFLQSHGKLSADKAHQLATTLPLGDLSCFRGDTTGHAIWSKDNPIIVVEPETRKWDSKWEAWVANSEDEFVEKVNTRYGILNPGEVVIERMTLRELAALADVNVDAPDDSEYDRCLFALAEQHGWDTRLQMSALIEDHSVIGREISPKIDALNAYQAALERMNLECLFFRGLDEALLALDDTETWNRYGIKPQHAIKTLLGKAGKLPKAIQARDIDKLELVIDGPPPQDEESWKRAKLLGVLSGVPRFQKTGAEVLYVGGYLWWPWTYWRFDSFETEQLFEHRLDELAGRLIREKLSATGIAESYEKQWKRHIERPKTAG